MIYYFKLCFWFCLPAVIAAESVICYHEAEFILSWPAVHSDHILFKS